MQDNISVLIATIVAVIIIVLFPIYNIATRQDSIANNMVVRATTNFVDEVRNKGYVDKESYGNFLKELDKTGNTYEVEMEVYKPILFSPDNTEAYEEKYEIDYTNDILSDMDNEYLYKDAGSVKKKNVYYLYEDYKFYVRVKNTNVTQAQILLDRLIGGKQDERIVVNYGGIVYDNEWAMGEGADNSEVSISISRPLDYQEKEYEYKYITSSFDPVSGKTDNIYAIAVELDDNDPNSGIINFKLRYTRVQFRDDNGNVLTDVTEIENHVEKYLELYGTEGIEITVNDIDVQKIGITEKNGYYDAEFLITFKDLAYNFEANPYLKTKARVRSGSAYSEAGKLGELNSTEFIVFYNINRLELSITASNVKVEQDTKIRTDLSKDTRDITFEYNAKILSPVGKIKKIKLEIINNETGVKIVDMEENVNESDIVKPFPLTLEKGRYKVIAYAEDTRGYNETQEFEFEVVKRETITKTWEKGFQNGAITSITTEIIEGYNIIGYNCKVYLPNHKPSWYDFFNIVNTETNAVISPIAPSASLGSKVYTNHKFIISGGYYTPPKVSDGIYYYQKYGTYNIVKTNEMTLAHAIDSIAWCSGGYSSWGSCRDGATNYPINTGNVDCRNENYTQLTFNYRIDPSHDFNMIDNTSVFIDNYGQVYFASEPIDRYTYYFSRLRIEFSDMWPTIYGTTVVAICRNNAKMYVTAIYEYAADL